MSAAPTKINLAQAFEQIAEPWKPHLAAEVNDAHVKLVKLNGAFVWHAHPAEDELFFVVRGAFVMRFREGDVPVNAGEFVLVPRGVEHCPVADAECDVMLIEPASTVNTGDAGGERTVRELERIR